MKGVTEVEKKGNMPSVGAKSVKKTDTGMFCSTGEVGSTTFPTHWKCSSQKGTCGDETVL